MPWWGWLIIGVVALVVIAWITVAAVGARTARRMSQDMAKGFDDFHKRW